MWMAQLTLLCHISTLCHPSLVGCWERWHDSWVYNDWTPNLQQGPLMGPRIRDPMKRFCFERILAVLHNSLLIKMLLHPPQGLRGSCLLSSAIESSSQSSEPYFGYIIFWSSPIQREQDPLCYPNSFLRRLRPSWRSLAWPLPRQTSPRKTAPPHPSTQSATGMSRTSGAPVSEAATAMVTVSWTVAATLTRSISTAWRSRAGTRYDFIYNLVQRNTRQRLS